MVTFIGTQEMQTHLRLVTPETAITRMAQMIKEDYLRWEMFDKSARVANHSADGVIELMPISDGKNYSFKYVNGHPKNTQAGLLTVTAFGVLADVDTGYPRLLSELTLTTALRTAATSALAATYMARPNSRSMALIGNGAQSEFQAIAFHAMLGIEELRVYDVDPAATDKLIHNLRAYPQLRVIRAASVAAAVLGADIVTTVTADKTNATILTPEMIRPGMHINGVGGDCPGKTELHADILQRAHVVVEYEPQSRMEGELQQMPADFAVTELWTILAGSASGRSNAEQVTVFDSVGFALEDFSAMRYLEKYVMQKTSALLDLIPEMMNPKDLYGMGMATQVAAATSTPTQTAGNATELPIHA
ncbi:MULTISPECIES: ornithine cyclodeaminase [unclassified Undibacterium]|uniref:ornithine cyclodeaminase n=1 Tax=unclassified Undibacterium TaxID=2630295 RepID=UPI002B228E51|nr:MULTISPECIES: ornithine cyclodeaminase [unclassified Undibacterium]MEB0139248.1 ornithine cyclodeaminase [Undibacterium sp. CCC2.1]MEB0172092.1 ornithine cyclodeaminase [Undibacterium sp. CCC1.1]MEB0175967.1 ornithine cyclodeaminase [Undibacterium sp. CCC3.4]MEB0215279.1 ornithine cyclodeaminase [Undibacterium sp. 5I2]